MTARLLTVDEVAARRRAVVAREQVDDPQAWAEFVALLADLLFPPAPDEPIRR